jgi:hypothetical protein
MAVQRIPVGMDVEYRGLEAPRQFTARDSGEEVNVPARIKFEYETDDGDVVLMPVSASQLDKVSPPFNYSELKRGDRVHLSGYVLLQERGSDRDSYLQITAVEPLGLPQRSSPAKAS